MNAPRRPGAGRSVVSSITSARRTAILVLRDRRHGARGPARRCESSAHQAGARVSARSRPSMIPGCIPPRIPHTAAGARSGIAAGQYLRGRGRLCGWQLTSCRTCASGWTTTWADDDVGGRGTTLTGFMRESERLAMGVEQVANVQARVAHAKTRPRAARLRPAAVVALWGGDLRPRPAISAGRRGVKAGRPAPRVDWVHQQHGFQRHGRPSSGWDLSSGLSWSRTTWTTIVRLKRPSGFSWNRDATRCASAQGAQIRPQHKPSPHDSAIALPLPVEDEPE